MKARNLHEKSRPPTCGCKSWLEHWENNSGQTAGSCSVLDCEKPADDGGHVQITEVDDNSLLGLQASRDNAWYIIPLCHRCNLKYGQEYEVKPGTIFVPVGKTSNCGKG